MTSLGGTVAFGLVIIALLSCGCQRKQREPAGREEMRELIDSEIPTGSSESQVVAFLDRHGFKYSNELPSQRAIFSVARDSSSKNLVNTSLHVTFRFDEERKLHDYTISESLVGP
jgi:hypothetical protein